MSRLEASITSLFVFSIHSWSKFGLELEAFHDYGLMTQAYGMATFPITGNRFKYSMVLQAVFTQTEKLACDRSCECSSTRVHVPGTKFVNPKIPQLFIELSLNISICLVMVCVSS